MNSSRFRCVLLLLLLAVSVRAANPPAPAGAAAPFPLTAYADVGFVFGDNGKLSQLGWTPEQFEAFIAGLRESYAGKPHAFDPATPALSESISRRLQQLAQEEARAFNDSLKDPVRLEAYLKEMSQQMHLERSDSGLAYGVRGLTGSVRPQPEDTVVVTWSVRTPDMKTEIPQLNVTKASLPVAKLLPGLAEGVQMMSAGSAAMLILPPDLSYGSGEWPPGVERGTPLVYMVKLEQVIPGS
jgi:FKBP-type peptidyl-prolyl cis-trans isomerase